jgi:hypothetical protein
MFESGSRGRLVNASNVLLNPRGYGVEPPTLIEADFPQLF